MTDIRASHYFFTFVVSEGIYKAKLKLLTHQDDPVETALELAVTDSAVSAKNFTDESHNLVKVSRRHVFRAQNSLDPCTLCHQVNTVVQSTLPQVVRSLGGSMGCVLVALGDKSTGDFWCFCNVVFIANTV